MMDTLARVGEFSGTTDGWGWRTNGHMIVAVQGLELPDNAPAHGVRKPGVEKFVRELVARPVGPRMARACDLREIAGSVCERCDGARLLSCSDPRCEECYGDGEHRCPGCRDENGDPARVVGILGALFDAQLLACVLWACGADTLEVDLVAQGDYGRSLRLTADGWRAALMEGLFEGDDAVEFAAWVDRPKVGPGADGGTA
jgi:hypothetical protein